MSRDLARILSRPLNVDGFVNNALQTLIYSRTSIINEDFGMEEPMEEIGTGRFAGVGGSRPHRHMIFAAGWHSLFSGKLGGKG